MALPLVLAGPILRRVEPNLVAVWVALNKACTCKLALWENQIAATDASDSNVWFRSPDPGTKSVRVGDNLHLAVITVRLPEAKKLQPERLYSYDVELVVQGQSAKQNLKSLGLLTHDPANADPNGDNVKRLALGYEVGLLPCLVLPPKELTSLRLAHGSCRNPNNALPDGLAWVDDLFTTDKAYASALKRPHQLFLTGDQIYADDVSRPMLHMLAETVTTLFGTMKEELPFSDPAQETKVGTAAASVVNFPPGKRLNLLRNDAGMTTMDGHSHLMSFGEFCAMYLYVWSNEVWEDKLNKLPTLAQLNGATAIDAAQPPRLRELLSKRHDGSNAEFDNYEQGSFDSDKRNLVEFRRTLPKVRRALANVATYMVFDDHEVTDDWYMTQSWRDRVLGSALGSAVVRNGMLAYALFQAWGNDPVKFEPRAGNSEKQPHEQLMELAPLFLPAGATKGPDRAAGKPAALIEELLGLTLRNSQAADGHFAETNPKLKWFYTVPGPQHQVLVLDCRTRRSFASRVSPPGNIGLEGQKEQIPDKPDPADKKVWLVVSSLPVVGPPIFDELFAPLLVRAFDFKDRNDLKRDRGSKGMVGTNPDAVEAWCFDPKMFENLLTRLRPYSPVVLLSGDVHYSASNAMSYWYKQKAEDAKVVAEPARFVQLISSGLKNVMPAIIRFADRSFAFTQKMIRAEVGAERLGFTKSSPTPVTIPAGVTIAPRMRGALRKAPVMIPTRNWKKSTLAREPDWAWRVTALRDLRADSERPKMVQPNTLFPDNNSKKDNDVETTDLASYHRVAERHSRQLERQANSRQILFASCLGLVTFQKRSEKDKSGNPVDVIYVVHDLFTIQNDPTELTKRPAPFAYTRHESPLRDLQGAVPTLVEGGSPTRAANES